MAKMASKKVVKKEEVKAEAEVNKEELQNLSWVKIKQETEVLGEDLKELRKGVVHRELGMAYDGLMKALKEVDVWLQTVADVEMAIEKKAKKA